MFITDYLSFFTQNLGQIVVLWTIELLMNTHNESEMSKSIFTHLKKRVKSE